MLVLLLGGGIYLTFRVDFIQFKHFGFVWSQTVGSLFRKQEDRNNKKGTITPFQAVTAELGSTVGASNIIGVSVALSGSAASIGINPWLSGLIISLALAVIVFCGFHYLCHSFLWGKASLFLFGMRFSLVMRFVYIAACFIGAVGGLKTVWLFLDLFLALVVVPNLIKVLGLSSKVVKKTKQFFKFYQ